MGMRQTTAARGQTDARQSCSSGEVGPGDNPCASAAMRRGFAMPTSFRGIGIFAWLVAIHAAALAGLILYPRPGWTILAPFFLLALAGGLGTTVAYHRALAHNAVRLHPLVQSLLIGFAMINGAGAPGSWTSTHRLHHAAADTPEDPSSPIWRGFWWAHAAWIWDDGSRPPAKYAWDRARFRRWDRMLAPMLALGFFIGAPFGWAALLWLGPIRLALAFNATAVVNSVCHRGPVHATREAGARNVPWLAPLQLFLGENWHRNHHGSPSSPRLGAGWRQPDLGYWTIAALEKIGLAETRGLRNASMAE